jgi:hypothetical protein
MNLCILSCLWPLTNPYICKRSKKIEQIKSKNLFCTGTQLHQFYFTEKHLKNKPGRETQRALVARAAPVETDQLVGMVASPLCQSAQPADAHTARQTKMFYSVNRKLST